ncbi:superoxide dismutase family protein [Chryseobacterium scophthalmum]|uniref:Superoxide dismutase, Cu-Zn family n=1 Tax=Chryseobacterium scophthalmum TaxID=59733 RepID=A0A1N6HED3_9FLAO|nr:superoxide dismutase family protein [Chryseobacterium scophthalmum]SIO17965.1 superoxide dismutase, Cu-Zn family [Chryseobacterium scophthalmum]
MKLQTLTLLASCALFATSCSSSKTYNVLAKSGTETGGTAKFTQNGNEVVMDLEVTNLTPGIHAVHIHEKGDCSAPDATSAGGHWNPGNHDHGKWGSEHFHMGDIGNLEAGTDGKAKLTFKTDKWCLDCVDESKNIIGKGIIIHADKDDFMTQPTGNAGGRVGCIEIK